MVKFGFYPKRGRRGMVNLGFYPGKNLPDVRLQATRLDRVLEGAALLLWILGCVTAVYCLVNVPDSELQKKALVSLGVSTLLMGLMAYSSYAPIRQFNFPFRVTERTVVVQYRLATRLCRVFNIVLGLMFLTVSLAGVGHSLDLNKGLTLVAAPAMVLAFVGYWGLAYKYK